MEPVGCFAVCGLYDKFEFIGKFARRYNSEWLPLEGELADARYERLTEEVCGEFWVCR